MRRQVGYVRADVGHVPAQAMTGPELAKLAQRWRARGLAPSTTRDRLATLGQAFRLGVVHKRVREAPALPRIEVRNARLGFIEPAEFDLIATGCPHVYGQVVRFAWLTAWRQGEILGLTWDQVGANRAELRLETTKKRRRAHAPGSRVSEGAARCALEGSRHRVPVRLPPAREGTPGDAPAAALQGRRGEGWFPEPDFSRPAAVRHPEHGAGRCTSHRCNANLRAQVRVRVPALRHRQHPGRRGGARANGGICEAGRGGTLVRHVDDDALLEAARPRLLAERRAALDLLLDRVDVDHRVIGSPVGCHLSDEKPIVSIDQVHTQHVHHLGGVERSSSAKDPRREQHALRPLALQGIVQLLVPLAWGVQVVGDEVKHCEPHVAPELFRVWAGISIARPDQRPLERENADHSRTIRRSGSTQVAPK